MIKFIMAMQMAFFLLVGTQVVQHERQCARNQAVSEIFVNLPVTALSEIRI